MLASHQQNKMMHAYEQYEQFRPQGPVIIQRGLQGSVAYVIGHEAAKQVLGDRKRFVKDIRSLMSPIERLRLSQQSADTFSLIYNNMLNTDPPDHTRLRALVSKAFTNRTIQLLEPRIQQIANVLIDQFAAKGAVDLVEAYAFPLPIIVICELLGIPAADRDKFRKWSHAFIGIADNDHAYVQLLGEFVQYIGRTVADRRANPRDDLISALVHAEEDGARLNEQELYSMIALLIVAGHETTVSLISGGMLALLQHPDQAARLRRTPALIETAIEEFLRYDPPVQMATTRYAAEDVTLGGQHVPRGTSIVVILAAANRDPAIYSTASALDIEREANKHLGFGYGIHYCVGAPLARLEARIAFNTLLARLPTMQLAVAPAQLQYNEGVIVRGLVDLPVRWA